MLLMKVLKRVEDESDCNGWNTSSYFSCHFNNIIWWFCQPVGALLIPMYFISSLSVCLCKAILLQCEVSSSLCNWVLELIFNLFSKWIFQNYFWMSFKCPWKVWDVFIHIFPLFSLWVMTWDAYLIPNDNFLDKKSLSHYIWGCSSADFPILTIITQTIKYLSTPHL